MQNLTNFLIILELNSPADKSNVPTAKVIEKITNLFNRKSLIFCVFYLYNSVFFVVQNTAKSGLGF